MCRHVEDYSVFINIINVFHVCACVYYMIHDYLAHCLIHTHT